MTPEEDYADRKMRRQMGQPNSTNAAVVAVMIVIAISVVTWLGKQADEWFKQQQAADAPQPAQTDAK